MAKKQTKKKTMVTIKMIINTLEEKGNKVTYYKRKDGGYLIKSINGEKFSGAKGNAKAREMVGAKISRKRASQLANITYVNKEFRKLPSIVKKEFYDVKKSWNTNVKNGKYKKGTALKVYQEYGQEELLYKSIQNQRYALGLARYNNVDMFLYWLDDIIRMIENATKAKLLQILRDRISEKKSLIREYDLQDVILMIYDALHDLTIINPQFIQSCLKKLGI